MCLWIKNLLEDLGLGPKEAMKLHCGNTSAIEIAHNPIRHDITKHAEINKHFSKEKLEAGITASHLLGLNTNSQMFLPKQ